MSIVQKGISLLTKLWWLDIGGEFTYIEVRVYLQVCRKGHTETQWEVVDKMQKWLLHGVRSAYHFKSRWDKPNCCLCGNEVLDLYARICIPLKPSVERVRVFGFLLVCKALRINSELHSEFDGGRNLKIGVLGRSFSRTLLRNVVWPLRDSLREWTLWPAAWDIIECMYLSKLCCMSNYNVFVIYWILSNHKNIWCPELRIFWNHLKLAGRGIGVKRLGATHGLHSLLLNTREQISTGWNIMNQSNDLSSSPHL